MGYNVQTAVDAKHHLIVAHEVTNSVTDRGQLAAMAKAAKEAIGHPQPTVLADRGYFEGYEILECERRGHRNAGAEAADLEQQSRGKVRQARLHL